MSNAEFLKFVSIILSNHPYGDNDASDTFYRLRELFCFSSAVLEGAFEKLCEYDLLNINNFNILSIEANAAVFNRSMGALDLAPITGIRETEGTLTRYCSFVLSGLMGIKKLGLLNSDNFKRLQEIYENSIYFSCLDKTGLDQLKEFQKSISVLLKLKPYILKQFMTVVCSDFKWHQYEPYPVEYNIDNNQEFIDQISALNNLVYSAESDPNKLIDATKQFFKLCSTTNLAQGLTCLLEANLVNEQNKKIVAIILNHSNPIIAAKLIVKLANTNSLTTLKLLALTGCHLEGIHDVDIAWTRLLKQEKNQEIIKNARMLASSIAQGGIFSKLPVELLAKIACDTRDSDVLENEAIKVALRNLNRPSVK